MKKRDLAALAMIGISAATLIGGCQKQGTTPNKPGSNTQAAEQMSPDMLNFYNSLTHSSQKKFNDLDMTHKNRAVRMLNQPPGQNDCKGLGSCKTSAHDCAGLNECKGQGGGPMVTDSNKAVDAQMMAQRKERDRSNSHMRSGSNMMNPGGSGNNSGGYNAGQGQVPMNQ